MAKKKRKSRKGRRKHRPPCPIKRRATVGGIHVALYRKSVKNAHGSGHHSRVYARRVKKGGTC